LDGGHGRIGVNGLFMISRHSAGMAHRRHVAMSIVQSGLPLALSAPFILAAWIAFLHRQRPTTCPESPYPPVEANEADLLDLYLGSVAVDLDAALREAAAAVEPVACSRGVRMELAVGAAMIVPVHASVLRMALRNTMLAAIDAAPGGQVLITAASLGRQLYIGIIDDGRGIDQQAREISMRQTETLIALQGGSIAIEARPGRGTVVTIRLPMPVSAESEASGSMRIPVLADQDA
jgi:signal transduction histidine kinase